MPRFRLRALLPALAALACAVLPAAPAAAAPQSTAAFYAERLAEDPVYVSDHLAGPGVERTRSGIAAATARLDVPVHVIVAPALSEDYDLRPLLAAVHDRLGEDGVYLAVTGDISLQLTGAAYGVSVPGLDDAVTEAGYLDAGPVRLVERTVDNLLSGEAAARLGRAQEASREESAAYDEDAETGSGMWADLADDLDSDSVVGRNNIGFTAGIGAGAAAVLIGYPVVRAVRAAAPARRAGRS
ncbi:hypothetical protein ACFPZ0_27445 [Streptomonospora nanhaiensis]|uniref:TPM domain-containing protein n=1 Tax=Streptomonospora nanhaiensis TaxID=1323731 RepID=A0A853BRI8_9ACTN|nr:hypothetical protein [Streptomonospora nanhaiensis]MBV2366513.1 hypothetical protein [Streptomonospora nanhaiensis]MBX9391924.1 hypothetical protein [Streptomonospora nanhaiensis]NYI98359.1 hypothetical protein [Streptomonospora nanhaiensis]